jgi:hypothetical protein
MNTFNTNEAVIAQMRSDFVKGHNLSEIFAAAKTSLGEQGKSTLVMVSHFWVAFKLSLYNARMLETCPLLGGAARTVDEVDAILRPEMAKCFRSDP